MTRVISENVGAFYHHHPKVAAIVTAQAKGKKNAMTVDWHTSLSLNPPLYGICIVPGRFTYQLIIDSKEFGINFLPFEAVDLIHQVGSSGGQQIDKFQRFNITRDEPIKTGVPILKAAYAAYECQLVDDRDYGDHNLLVGKIVAVHRLQEAFTPEEMLDLDKVRPVLYLGDELYLTSSGDTVRHLESVGY
ncbi:MAG: flavin reductase [Chloroflexi bacterium]|nr:flavin reductase [Chloroflexota bacterium]